MSLAACSSPANNLGGFSSSSSKPRVLTSNLINGAPTIPTLNSPATETDNINGAVVDNLIDAGANNLARNARHTPAKPSVGESAYFQPFRQEFQNSDGQLSPYLQQWAEELAQARGIPLAVIESLLSQVRYDPQVIRLMTPQKGGRVKRSWQTYRGRFVDDVRVQAGLNFWQRHAQHIAQVAQQYQIPESVLVAIIGVETIFGQYLGNFKVLNSLANLGFSYPDAQRPERAAMFREQLADFIELHYQRKVDANSAFGSFAGAMGLPQFMPTSIKNWAVDAEHKGYVDLYNSIPDTLASIANFLNHHGWQPDWPVFLDLPYQNKELVELVDGGLSPTLSWEDLQRAHIAPAIDAQKAQQQQFGLIDLVEETRGTTEFRLATPNFFALTSYNRSYFYATAVADLACVLERTYYQTSEVCRLWRYPQ